jgi:coenzyme F420 hydrogenase subunit beta
LNELGESRTRLEVINSAGSRYAPSAPLADIVKRLEFPEKFIFVGKPCDVAALRAYAEHDERVNDRVVAMLSFMCGGIPSETGIRKIFATMGIGEGDVTSFRYRGNGWPGQTTATLPDQSQRTLSYEDTWGNILSWHLQKRCKICPDGIGLFADVVFADAWHLSEEGAPLFDEEGGRSLVIARNQLGSEIVSGAMALEYLKAEPEPLERIEKMQPFQAARIRLTASRLLAMFVLGRYIPKFSGLHLLRSALAVGCAANIRSFLGAGLRVLRGRL